MNLPPWAIVALQAVMNLLASLMHMATANPTVEPIDSKMQPQSDLDHLKLAFYHVKEVLAKGGHSAEPISGTGPIPMDKPQSGLAKSPASGPAQKPDK